MVPTTEQLKTRFYIQDNILYWKNGPRKNKRAGNYQKDGYIGVRVTINNKNYFLHAHRIIFSLIYGFIPKLIDHIDRNPLNNNPENLRESNKQVNSINTGMFKHNSSGYRGVYWNKFSWIAYIKSNGKKYHLGSFKNLAEAIKCRKEAEDFYWNIQ